MTMQTCNEAPMTFAPARVRISLISYIQMLRAARRQRSALGKLDHAALQDLGLTRQQAQAEATRPIWDVPANWRG